MILKISLRAKAGVPKTLLKRKFRLHSLHFLQNTLMLTESRGEFSDLHSIFRLRALRYCHHWMMSSSANYRPFLSSFRHIPPQEHFVKLANFNYSDRTWPPVRNFYLIKIGPKSLGHTRRDICKDKESDLGPVAGY